MAADPNQPIDPGQASQLAVPEMEKIPQENPFDYIGRQFARGRDETTQDYKNAWLMGTGGAGMSENDELNALQASAQKVGQTPEFDQHAHDAQPWVVQAAGDAAQMLPSMGDTIGAGLVGGATLVGAETLTGAPITAALGKANPIIQGAIGTTAFGAGFTAGSAGAIWTQTAGNMYGELRQAGMNRDTARNLALTFGSFNASMNVIGLKAMGGLAGKSMSAGAQQAIGKSLDTPFVKKIQQNVFSRLGFEYAKEVGTLTATAGAQNLSSELAKVVGGLAEKNQADAYTSWDKAAASTKQTMFTALGAALFLGAGGIVGGHVAGQISKGSEQAIKRIDVADPEVQREIGKALEGKTPAEIVGLVHKGLDEIKGAWESPEQKGPKIVYDQNGNPVFKLEVSQSAVGENNPLPIGKEATTLAQLRENAQPNIQQGLQAVYPTEKEITPQQLAEAQAAQKSGLNLQPGNPAEEGSQLRLPLQEWRPLNPQETQARQNQITSDLQSLRQETRRLEGEIFRKEKIGQSTSKLQDRWNKVGQTMDALESEHSLLSTGLNMSPDQLREAGFGTTDIEGPKFGKLRIRTLAKQFDKITDQANQISALKGQVQETKQQALELGFKRGVFQTERAIRKGQAQLEQLVQVVTQDRDIRAKMRQYINRVTNPEQLAAAAQRIKEQALKFETQKFETQDKIDRQKVFAKVEKMVNGNRVRLQSGYPKAPLPVDITEKLETLRGFLKDKKNVTTWMEGFAKDYGANTPIDQLPSDVAQNLQLANMAQNLYTGTSIERNVTAGNIAQWIADGKSIMEKRAAELAVKKDAQIQTANGSLGVEANPKEKSHVLTSGQRRTNFLRGPINQVLTWNSLLDSLTGTDNTKALSKLLDTTEARSKYVAGKQLAAQSLMNFLNRELPNGNNIFQKAADDNKNTLTVNFQHKDGTFHQETMSKAQLLDAAMKMKDESLHPGLRDTDTGNGWTLRGDVAPGHSFQELVEGHLTETDKAQMQALFNFYSDQHDHINEDYRNTFGYDLPMRENYSPTTRGNVKVDTLFSEQALEHWNLLPGSAKSREDSLKAVTLHNPIEDALKYSDNWAYWKHYKDTISAIRNVFGDPGIRNHVEQNFGHGTMHVIDNYIESFVKNNATPNSPFWNALRGDISRAALGGRLASVFPHVTAGIPMMNGYDPITLGKGIANTILHPVETQAALNESPILKERHKEGQGYDLQFALHQQGLFGGVISKILGHEPESMNMDHYNLYNRLLYGAISGGHVVSDRIFGGVVYQAEKAAGKSHEDALSTVERKIEQTQLSTDPAQVPMSLRNPVVNTLFGMFTQQPQQMLGRTIVAANDAFSRPMDWKAWRDLGNVYASHVLVPGLLNGLFASMPFWLAPQSNVNQDQENRQWASDLAKRALLEPLLKTPIAGDAIDALWLAAAKPIFGMDNAQLADYYGKNPVYQTLIQNPYEAFKLWQSLEKPKSLEQLATFNIAAERAKETKAQLATVRAAAPLLGLPSVAGSLPFLVNDRLEANDIPGAAMAVGGFSPGMITRRTPTSSFYKEFKDLQLQMKAKDANLYDITGNFFNSVTSDSAMAEHEKAQEQSGKETEDILKGIQEQNQQEEEYSHQ